MRRRKLSSDWLLVFVRVRVNWISAQVQCMSAKVKWMKCLSNIYIKERVTSKKIPTRVPTKSSTVRFASCRWIWGTWSHRNLMKARLRCWSIRSVRWAVKKVTAQAEVMYAKREVIVVISKSSFLHEEPKRRISKGYCRGGGPISTYLYIYWAGGPIQGH